MDTINRRRDQSPAASKSRASASNGNHRQSPAEGKPRSLRSKIVRWMWIAFGAGLAVMIMFFILIYNGVIGYMPPVEELRNPVDRYASVLYSADGQEMGRYYRNSGNRVYADFNDISPNVINALIATEDSRFLDHSGIDMRAMGRVFFKTLILGNKNSGGGSTITQQLAKQLYSPDSHGFFARALQKPIEWMIAIKLERFYSKDEILRMYLNQFDFLYNAVGIKSAAFVYFGKDPKDLSVEEAALLVGMVKNPAYYNPIRHPERALERRNTVFQLMEKNGMLSRADVDRLSATPLNVSFHRVDHKDGIAPYFREEVRHMMTAKQPDPSDYPSWDRQKFIDDSIAWETNPLYGWIEKNPKPDGSKYDLYSDGLKIYTSIDSRMQKYAEEAVNEHMRSLQRAFNAEKRGSSSAPFTSNRTELPEAQLKRIIERSVKNTDRYRNMAKAGYSHDEILRAFNEKTEMRVFSYNGIRDTVMTPMDSLMYTKSFLRTGFMAMDPKSGQVKAYVGGTNFEFFQYDMVSKGRRQIGSTMKPFLYTYAMEEGYTPCDQFLNTQPVIIDLAGNKWIPKGSGGSIGSMVNLKWALTNSSNWISARLMNELDPAVLVRNLHNLGVTADIKPTMSICLGSCEVSVKEMVTAYSAFANKGMRVDPIYVTSIQDSNGNTIASFSPKHTEVIGEKAYYRILSMLQSVVDHGTGRRLRGAPYNISAEMGGKTGTTNHNSDGWFMGFTPDIVAATWVGGEERFIHFNSGAMGQGASMALPIFGKFMTKVYKDPKLPYRQDVRFEYPEDIDLCEKEYYGTFYDDSGAYDPDAHELESIEGAFD